MYILLDLGPVLPLDKPVGLRWTFLLLRDCRLRMYVYPIANVPDSGFGEKGADTLYSISFKNMWMMSMQMSGLTIVGAEGGV